MAAIRAAHTVKEKLATTAPALPAACYKKPMAAILRTRTLSETRGFVKAPVAEDDRILDFTIFGADGKEPMSAVQIAMIARLPYTALPDAILAHPILAEG